MLLISRSFTLILFAPERNDGNDGMDVADGFVVVAVDDPFVVALTVVVVGVGGDADEDGNAAGVSSFPFDRPRPSVPVLVSLGRECRMAGQLAVRLPVYFDRDSRFLR